MDIMHLVEKAIALAVEAHAGEVDKEGKPYILHPLRLMMQMDTAEEMKWIAYLRTSPMWCPATGKRPQLTQKPYLLNDEISNL